jgi:iron complex outermembrane receptor protein
VAVAVYQASHVRLAAIVTTTEPRGFHVYQTNLPKRSLRAALLLGAASATALSLSLPVLAQDEGTETVIVTGSRIPQTGLYSASPVTAVSQQEMKFEGTTDVANLLNNLPAAFGDQSSGVSNGSTGTATVDLRDLGCKRTLVLVDGTRLMPGDPNNDEAFNNCADLNVIPAALVDHVEVLTGGASAVYGSDALAGVVNFIMRKDFEGIELDGTYSTAEADNNVSEWRNQTQINVDAGAYGFAQSPEGIVNGENEDATLLVGTNTANDKGNITAYLGYRNVAPVLEASRDYSECTIASSGPGATCSGSSNYNRWISIDNGVAGGFSSAKVPWDYFETGTGKPGSGKFTTFNDSAGTQHFNYGAYNYLQRPDTRYTGGYYAHYEVNKELDIYSNFMFSDDHTVAQIAQSGLFLGSGTFTSGTQLVNCSNPLMTAQENAQLCGQTSTAQMTVNGRTFYSGAGNLVPGQAELEIGRRDIEGGDRRDDLRHTAYRMNIGAKGDLGGGWTYDVYAQEGLSLYSENYTGEFSKARVQNALEVDPATGQCYAAETGIGNTAPSAPGCVPLDIFNGIGSINNIPNALNYVSADGLKEGWTQEKVVSGSLTGDLGEWGGQSPWAKSPIGVSVGSEYRQEQLELTTDQEFSTNDLYGQGSATLSIPTSGYSVVEGFTEVQIPLVQDKPLFEDLSFNGGYRYSSYSIAGATSTYKYGLEWQPIDDFRIRSSAQRSVRAPNVQELFAPENEILFSGNDPCAAIKTGKCAGVPNAGTALLSCPATQCDQTVSGNQMLKPETSDTRSIGLVFTPSFFDGFTATVDWFDIKVNDYINTLPPQEILDECYTSGNAAAEAYYCPMVVRNGNGQVYGSGFVSTPTLNTGYLSTSGVDFEVNYQTSGDDWGHPGWGSLSANLVGTWLDTFMTEPVPINPQTEAAGVVQPFNCAGLYGQTCGEPAPKWRHKLRVTWASPWDVDLSFQWRYVGAIAYDADTTNPLLGGNTNTTTCPSGRVINGGPFNPDSGVLGGDCWDARVSSYSYFDLAGDWHIREGVDIHGGVNNIVGTEPPVIGLSALTAVFGNGNTFPGTYDTLGRFFFVGATIKY